MCPFPSSVLSSCPSSLSLLYLPSVLSSCLPFFCSWPCSCCATKRPVFLRHLLLLFILFISQSPSWNHTSHQPRNRATKAAATCSSRHKLLTQGLSTQKITMAPKSPCSAATVAVQPAAPVDGQNSWPSARNFELKSLKPRIAPLKSTEAVPSKTSSHSVCPFCPFCPWAELHAMDPWLNSIHQCDWPMPNLSENAPCKCWAIWAIWMPKLYIYIYIIYI